jgi:hypothetical protein
VRRAFAVIAFLAAIWALAVRLSGGFAVSVGGLRLSSSDAIRPLIVAAIAAAIYVGLSGMTRARADAAALRRRLTFPLLAAMLTAVVLVVGIANNSWSAGGSDSYSYVSQADLWLQGNLKVPVPIADAAPWPNALVTFTPLGYRTVPNETAITPVTGPGLPLLMAAFKLVAGHPAAFLVAPLSGALLVWTTFLIGRRLGSDPIGLGGAWLVATSPTFLMMFKSQMSDVPAAAFWALATYWVLGRTVRSAVAAGLAASIAILIRPNLVPIAAVLAVWAMFEARTLQVREASHKGSPHTRAATFALSTLPGCLAVAAIDNWLYGSPLSSGYGDLTAIFSLANIPVTLASYARWFIDTQTPVAAIGVVALLIAPARIWPDAPARAGARLLACVLIAVWALYSAYPAFEAWWFLRFLLPVWPAIFIGTAAGIAWLFDGRVKWGRALTVLTILALGIYGLAVTARRHVFTADEGERRYATIAKLVEAQTEPSAMILASMHVGSVRYYAARATMRFDLLDEAWLDRTADWLQQQGRHPYVLVEDWEMPVFTRRFAGTNRLGDLRMAPALAYRAYRIPGTIYLFDLLRPSGPTIEPPPIRDPRPRAVLPATPPSLIAHGAP